MSEAFTNLALTQFGQVTLLVFVAGLAHQLLADRAPRWMLGLWTLVTVKAVTPPLLASEWGLFSWAQAALLSNNQPINATAGSVQWVESNSLHDSLLMAWLVGAGVATILVCRRQHRLEAVLRRDAVATDSRLARYTESLAADHNLSRPARLVVTRDELGPAVAGVFRPTIILPASLVNERQLADLRPVLLHELVHLNRRDPIVAVLNTCARVVWWFHPGVWWGLSRAEALVERCVDLTVTRDLQTSVLDYARGLVRVLELRARLHNNASGFGIRPCQITTQRLQFLRRQASRFETNWPLAWARRVAFGGLAVLLMPALPVDSLLASCEDARLPPSGCYHPVDSEMAELAPA